jgi:peptide/nickel transport system substrate-binding protein
MHLGWFVRAATLLALLLVACTPAAAPRTGEAPASSGGAPVPAASGQPGRTLVATIRVEPTMLASRLGQGGGATLTTTRRMFNAYLAIFDQRGEPQPYLAAQLPRLNTDSWRVFPDGRMETTYTLRPNLTWHDGQPLTAEDFVFSWRAYASPALGLAHAAPISLMDEVLAPDPLTVTIRWNAQHAKAGILTEEFPPMPRHILEAQLQTMAPEAFAALPFWTNQYVGAGPFRVDRWEPGAYMEATAFDRHVLGAPRIERMRLLFISDSNAALANMLSGEVHYAPEDSAIRFQQALTLQSEWKQRNGGSVLIKPDLWRSTFVQFHPERLQTPGLADVRVRRALAHTIDTNGINDAMFEGQGIMADVPFIPKTMGYYPAVESAAVKYPFDPARAQALLAEAGYTRGSDGVWASPTTGRLSFPLLTGATPQNETEMSVAAAGWRQVGFEVAETIMPAAQAQDGQARSVFPGLSIISIPLGEEGLADAGSVSLPGPENRWTGRNRGSWTNPEFDRLADAFKRTLDQQQRVQQIAQMVRIFTEDVPNISMYFSPTPVAHVAALTGPQNVDPAAETAWNIHQWEFR